MNTLSLLNNNSPSVCLFQTLNRCQNSTRGPSPFGIICPYHMNQLFQMNMKEDIISFPDRKVVRRIQVISNIPNSKKLLPFPITIDPAHESGEICFLDNVQMYSSVREFVHEINLSESVEKIEEVICLLCCLISDGRGYMFGPSPSLGQQLGHYMSFLGPNTLGTEMLKLMWKNVKVRCTKGDTNFLYPMTKLPIIYQILLAYVELSTVTTNVGTSSIVSLPANIFLDLDKQAFVLTNIDDPVQPIALNKDNATFCSPLILSGERITEKSSSYPSLFNRGVVTNGIACGQHSLFRVCR